MAQLVSTTWFALLLMQQLWQSDCRYGHLSLLYWCIFVWEWTRNVCHWATETDCYWINTSKLLTLWSICQRSRKLSLPFVYPLFFINLEPADVYNVGKVTLFCGSESVLGHYLLSAAHHHWSNKGLSTNTNKNIHRGRYNMWLLYCSTI